MFEKFYGGECVAKMLIPQKDYKPFPKNGASFTDEQKALLLENGEKYLNYDWPVPLATDYMKFVKEGTRVPYEHGNYAARRNALCALADAELVEDKGRFIPDIINGMWAIMDEATWVIPAHNYNAPLDHRIDKPLPDFDSPIGIALFTAGTAGLLSNVYYLFKEKMDAVTPLVCRRFEKVLDERILTPFMETYYWWMGLETGHAANWNPWIISNVLSCFGLVCKDETRRAHGIARCLLVLDQFVKGYHPAGGCDEGPGYWNMAGGALFDCLSELSQLSGGAFDCFFETSLVQNIAKYIYRVHIGKGYFTNYADAPLTTCPSGDIVYRFGKMIKDPDMIDMGVAMYYLSLEQGNAAMRMMGGAYSNYRHLCSLFGFAELSSQPKVKAPLVQSVFVDGVQVIAERQEKGAEDGLFLSAKGGSNSESHNHNDVGSFVIYSDSEPAIADLGSGQYNKFTFGPNRYNIMQMSAKYHNLPIVNGCSEIAGTSYDARTKVRASNVSYNRTEDGSSVFSLNLVNAYDPNAGLESLQRTFVYDRTAKKVTLTDEFALKNEQNEIDFVFIVPTAPEITDGSVLVKPIGATPVEITFDKALCARYEELDTASDAGLKRNWGDRAYRVLVHATCGKQAAYTFTFAQKA